MSVIVGRIEREFIFAFLNDSQPPLWLQKVGVRRSGKCIGVTTAAVRIAVDGTADAGGVVAAPAVPAPPALEDYRVGDTIQVFFWFKGATITFSARVDRAAAGEISVVRPERLHRSLSRAHGRVPRPKRLRVAVQFSATGGVARRTAAPAGATVNPEQIAQLVAHFRERAAAFADESRIVLFRGREPATIPEFLLSVTAKAVVVPSTHSGIVGSVVDEDVALLLPAECDALLEEHKAKLSGLSDHRGPFLRDPGADYAEELFYPITSGEQVLGYLYLMAKTDSSLNLDANRLETLHQLARVLGYALAPAASAAVATAPAASAAPTVEVIDVSLSGLLCAAADAPSIAVGSTATVFFQLPNHRFSVAATVARTFVDEHRTYIGLRFAQVGKNDQTILRAAIYPDEELSDTLPADDNEFGSD